MNDFITPKIAEEKGMNFVFGFGALLTIISLLALILLNIVDAASERKHHQNAVVVNESVRAFDFNELIA
jgi:hypothetical protein